MREETMRRRKMRKAKPIWVVYEKKIVITRTLTVLLAASLFVKVVEVSQPIFKSEGVVGKQKQWLQTHIVPFINRKNITWITRKNITVRKLKDEFCLKPNALFSSNKTI